jgi:magnesium-transporting ATPase (P-type)
LDSTPFLDVAILLVSSVLTMLSVHSLKLLTRIHLDKSLFIPVFVSAVFFWYASLVNVVFNLCLQNTPGLIVAQDSIDLVYRSMLLAGLSILTYGVFSYWRLTRKVKLPKRERMEKHKDQQEVTEESPAIIDRIGQQASA